VSLPKRTELGSPITKYSLQEIKWRDFWSVFLPLSLFVLTPVGIGFWRTLYGYSNYGPAAAAAWGRNWYILSGLLTIILLLYTYNRLIRAHTWIEVYPWGLYLHYPPGRKRLLKWEDITGITSFTISKRFLRVIRRTKSYLILHSMRYSPLSCHPDLKRREGLKKTIKKQVYKRLKPKLDKEFKSGKMIPFGYVSITKGALHLKKQEIPWEYVEGITVDKGMINLNLTTQNRIELPIRQIQNLEILIHLIKTEI
jgi:hypothetical protein